MKGGEKEVEFTKKLAYITAILSVALPAAINIIGIWWNGIGWSVL